MIAHIREPNVMSHNIKEVIKSEDQDIRSFLDFLLIEYIRIFDFNNEELEECTVYNDTSAKTPIFQHASNLQIRLALEDTSYWCQLIYQLSHELCHYVIRQFKKEKEMTLSWFEEIVCESFSLYILNWASKNWSYSPFYTQNTEYINSLHSYLENIIHKPSTDGFSLCRNLEMLTAYERDSRPENDRSSHRKERNNLYREILKAPLNCNIFCYYQDYMDDNGITINFLKWQKETNNPLLKTLKDIQPC